LPRISVFDARADVRIEIAGQQTTGSQMLNLHPEAKNAH
jgi:hypothetical protein